MFACNSDYLRTIVAGLEDPKVGAVTCFMRPVPSEEKDLRAACSIRGNAL